MTFLWQQRSLHPAPHSGNWITRLKLTSIPAHSKFRQPSPASSALEKEGGLLQDRRWLALTWLDSYLHSRRRGEMLKSQWCAEMRARWNSRHPQPPSFPNQEGGGGGKRLLISAAFRPQGHAPSTPLLHAPLPHPLPNPILDFREQSVSVVVNTLRVEFAIARAVVCIWLTD
jgi:hypothetical protein